MAIFIFNVPARTMKSERFALAGVPLLTEIRSKNTQCIPNGPIKKLLYLHEDSCLLFSRSIKLVPCYLQKNILYLYVREPCLGASPDGFTVNKAICKCNLSGEVGILLSY